MKGVEVRGLIVACFLAFLLGKAISHSFNIQAPPQPPAATASLPAATVPPPDPLEYDPEMIALGKEIFAQAEATYSSKSTYFDVWDSGYPDAAAALFMPAKVWDGLPEEKRDALAVLVQAEIPNIRKNPDKYIGFSRNTPLYKRLRTNVASIAEGRYVIMTTVQQSGKWIKGETVSEGR